MTTKLIRLEEVSNLTGLKKSALYRRISENTFPSPIKLGSKASRWSLVEIQQWIEKAVEVRHAK
ncbi:MAG: AlpA family transcriptional regulator [Alphaproteobacteria bacterium]|nr:AlpA family transcriptional regulator [Alphaproteobacteria bacterium]